jgi:hypothetical protein
LRAGKHRPRTGRQAISQLDATSACIATQQIVAAISRMHSMPPAGIDGLLTCLLRLWTCQGLLTHTLTHICATHTAHMAAGRPSSCPSCPSCAGTVHSSRSQQLTPVQRPPALGCAWPPGPGRPPRHDFQLRWASATAASFTTPPTPMAACPSTHLTSLPLIIISSLALGLPTLALLALQLAGTQTCACSTGGWHAALLSAAATVAHRC